MKFKDIKITWDGRLVFIGIDGGDYEINSNQGNLIVKRVVQTHPPKKPKVPWLTSFLDRFK